MDVGCGWGGFTALLCGRYEEVAAVDGALEHAVATKVLNPAATVYWGDARDMGGIAPECFDAVFARGVIEHVGEPGVDVGRSGDNLHHQPRFVKELARVCRPDGKVFLSTGNYNFPRDGEVNQWFYHWLPPEKKIEYCARRNISTDKYWLLSWAEVEFLLAFSGLFVECVFSPDTDTWDPFLDNLDRVFPDLDSCMVDIWRDVVKKDPRFLSSWIITARKTGMKRGVAYTKNDHCCYHRVTCVPGLSAGYCQVIDQMPLSGFLYRKLARLVQLFKPGYWRRQFSFRITYTIERAVLLQKIAAKMPAPLVRLVKRILLG
jgi:SAM-dependent methyltransferase